MNTDGCSKCACQEDSGRLTVVINEREDGRCAYAVCSMPPDGREGEPSILYGGVRSIDDVIEIALRLAEEHGAQVACDAKPSGQLWGRARHYHWQCVQSCKGDREADK